MFKRKDNNLIFIQVLQLFCLLLVLVTDFFGTGIVKQSMFICRFLIVVQRDYRMSVYMSWTFYGPVFQFFALKTAGVANPVLHFVILIFAGRHADDFFALHPQYS